MRMLTVLGAILLGAAGARAQSQSSLMALVSPFSWGGSVDGRRTVTCEMVTDPKQRVFQFEPMGSAEGSGWRLVFKSRETRSKPLALLLPGADVAMDKGRPSLTYRTANGGVMVSLETIEATTRLDVYVSYELEVNVDADLDPQIDQMNTEGPKTVRCEAVPKS